MRKSGRESQRIRDAKLIIGQRVFECGQKLLEENKELAGTKGVELPPKFNGKLDEIFAKKKRHSAWKPDFRTAAVTFCAIIVIITTFAICTLHVSAARKFIISFLEGVNDYAAINGTEPEIQVDLEG